LRLRLWLLLSLGRQMMPNSATSSRTTHPVWAGVVAGHGTDGRALDAALGIGSGGSGQQHHTHQ